MRLCRVFSWLAFASVLTVLRASEPGLTPLFNGRDLTGWEGMPEVFSVRDGMIHAKTTAERPLTKNTFLVHTAREFGDFELRFDFRVSGGNSGMQYRSERLPDFGMRGYQADFEDRNRYTGMFFDELTPDEAARKIKPRARFDKVKFATTEEVFSHIQDPRAWHSMTIIARGNTFVHILDGRVMSVAVDDDAAKLRRSGYIGLQVHSGSPMTIDLKNIRIRELK
jgi:hypothetical protein